MKFEKMQAHMVFNLKDGSKEEATLEEYDIRVSTLVRKLQGFIDEGLILRVKDGPICDGSDVESFEITNYEELIEYEKSLEDETQR